MWWSVGKDAMWSAGAGSMKLQKPSKVIYLDLLNYFAFYGILMITGESFSTNSPLFASSEGTSSLCLPPILSLVDQIWHGMIMLNAFTAVLST